MSDAYTAYRELLKALDKPTWKQIGLHLLKMTIVMASFSVCIMLLWNSCLVGSVDGVHPLSFWTALGLMLLVRIFPTPQIKG